MPTCANCGANLRPGTQECPGCGPAPWPEANRQPDPALRPPAQPPRWAPPPTSQWQQQWPPAEQTGPRQQPPLWVPPHQSEQVVPAYDQPRRGSGTGPIVVIASAALLVLAAVAVFIVFRHADTATGGTATPAASTVVPTTTDQPTTTEQPTTTQPTTTQPTTTQARIQTDEAAAEQELQQLVDADRPEVESLVGSWVSQLSSKNVGLVVNGVTFDYRAILADYQQEATAHPGSLLLRSEDYSDFRLAGFYVTVAPQPYSDPSDANAWCDGQGIDANDCFAERLMHGDNAQGDTVLRH